MIVETNPGPKPVTVRLRLFNTDDAHRKGAGIEDLINTHHIDVLAACET